MSLVNKMLRDLDARRAGIDERGPLPTAVSPLPMDEEGTGRKLAVGVFAVLGLALAAALQFHWLPMEVEDVPMSVPSVRPKPPLPASPVAVVEQETVPAQLPVASDAVPPAPTLLVAAEAGLRLESQLLSLPLPTKIEPAPAARIEAGPEPKVEPKTEPKAEVKLANVAPRPVAKSEPKVVAVPATNLSNDGRIDKQPLRPPALDRADAEYKQAVLVQRQGNVEEALTRYRRALVDQPDHLGARQALAGLLLEHHRYDEAENVLRAGIEIGSARLAFATMLARLKVERGDVPAALDILLQQSAVGEKSADYQGFVAALLNRLGRHGEASGRYRLATRLSSNEGRWWAGLGIALDAEGKNAEAREAYQHARALSGLSPDLLAHIDQRLKQQ